MTNSSADRAPHLRRIHLQYDNEKGDESALQLVLAVQPEWEKTKDDINFIRFTDGITNNVGYRSGTRALQISESPIDLLSPYAAFQSGE